jgi:hypothetical protein
MYCQQFLYERISYTLIQYEAIHSHWPRDVFPGTIYLTAGRIDIVFSQLAAGASLRA